MRDEKRKRDKNLEYGKALKDQMIFNKEFLRVKEKAAHDEAKKEAREAAILTRRKDLMLEQKLKEHAVSYHYVIYINEAIYYTYYFDCKR